MKKVLLSLFIVSCSLFVKSQTDTTHVVSNQLFTYKSYKGNKTRNLTHTPNKQCKVFMKQYESLNSNEMVYDVQKLSSRGWSKVKVINNFNFDYILIMEK